MAINILVVPYIAWYYYNNKI